MPKVIRNVAPVATRKALDTTNEQIGQDQSATMSPVGEAVIERPVVQTVDGPRSKDFLDALAFNEEMVTVTVHPSPNPEDGKLVTIWVDGKVQNFFRGEPMTVKRKYVEGLARAKPVNYRSEEFVNADGDKAFRYPSTTGLRFPFQVDHDANPNGAAWLRQVLAQG
jgi:hypothetical protein